MYSLSIIRRVGAAAALAVCWVLLISTTLAHAQPQVPGFDVRIYANVTNPATLSFDPDGLLYVGNGANPSRIHRIGIGGAPIEEYGDETPDPDAVLFDASGVIAGVPGSVLVAGSTNDGFPPGYVSAIYPDQTTVTIFEDTSFTNIQYLKFDRNGRLLLGDVFTFNVLVSTGDNPQILSTTGGRAFAVDGANRIVVGRRDNEGNLIIVVLAPDGTVIDSEFARIVGFGEVRGLAFGSYNSVWGGNLFVLAGEPFFGGDVRLFQIDAEGVVNEVGRGFRGGDLAIGPDDALYVSDENVVYRITPKEIPSFVAIDGCETEVPDQLVDDQHTISDLILQCEAGASNHGQFVSCVAHFTNGLKKAGMIGGQEKGAIMSCAGQAAIP